VLGARLARRESHPVSPAEPRWPRRASVGVAMVGEAVGAATDGAAVGDGEVGASGSDGHTGAAIGGSAGILGGTTLFGMLRGRRIPTTGITAGIITATIRTTIRRTIRIRIITARRGTTRAHRIRSAIISPV
jgi:hypothetical protein